MNTTQLLPALLRTVVPLLYGLLIQIGLGRYVDDQTVTTVATLIVTGGIYLLLRLLERLQPKIGVLLGWAKQPQYADVIQGQMVHAQDAVEAATKDDLIDLRDQLLELLEKRITVSTQQTATAAGDAVHSALVAAQRKGASGR